MLTERETQMLAILRRLSCWNTEPLDDHPVQVLKGIVDDAEKMVCDIDEARRVTTDDPDQPDSDSS